MELTKQQSADYRRSLSSIHESGRIQDILTEQGFYTPFHIAAVSKRQFLRQAGERMDIGKQQAEKIYNRAQKVSQKAMHLYMNLKTTAGSAYSRAMNGYTAAGQMEAEFVNVPGYQELFGSLDYVQGDTWNSLFGLAAYFVDIMRITDRYVTGPNSDTIPSGMKLKERRPDLWKIPLDGQHTQEQVPYLAVVKERLMELAKKEMQTPYPFHCMASMKYPMSAAVNFPVNFPLEQIRIIMRKAGVPLERIYGCVSGDYTAVHRESMQISKDSLDMLGSPLSEQQLAEYYGTTKEELGSLVDVGTFMKVAGIGMEQLNALLYQDLRPDEREAAGCFFINRGCEKGKYISVKDMVLLNCDMGGLERINRFIRTSSLFGLSYVQTDWMLRCLSADGSLDAGFLDRAVAALDLFSRIDMDFYDFMGLFGQMKTYGADARFENIFHKGGRRYRPEGAWNPAYQDKIISWDVKGDMETAAWLAGSIGISMTQLRNLAEDIFAEDKVPLTIENMSLLYAQAVTGKALCRDMEEYRVIRKLLGIQPQLSQGQLEELYRVKTALDRYGLTVYDMDFLVNGTVTPYVTYRMSEDSLCRLLDYIWKWECDGGSAEEQEAQKSRFVVSALADYFRTEQEIIMAAEPFLGTAGTLEHWYDAFLARPEQGQHVSPYDQDIRRMLLAINRWLNVTEDSVPVAVMKSIGAHGAQYGFEDLTRITLDNWLSVYEFSDFCNRFGDTRCQLTGCVDFDEAGIRILSDVTSWPADQISRLLAGHKGTVTETLKALDDYFSCMDRLHADIDFMERLDGIRSIPLADYDALDDICSQLLSSIAVQDKTGESTDAVLAKERDGLILVLCWKMGIREEDLYKYLLMDIRMDDKTQISYIREGANAVQLYLQQCRMGFEEGVRFVEIDDSWWSWLLDYNMWAANRKNYVYPENYLIPSVRHTKTEPFEHVESGLMQSDITAGYVEELCIQYLEDMADRMEIVVAAACERDGTTYLFGRTKKQPYTFYYCSKNKTPVFTQWKEIKGCTVSSDRITPAVMFGKLHLFWAELKCITKSMLEDSKSVEGKSYTLDVKFTYQNTQGKWMPPQDLIQNELIYYEEDGRSPVDRMPLFQGVFHMEDEIWKKVSILPVSGKNYAPYENRSLYTEKFMVVYGMPLNNAENTSGGNILHDMAGSDAKLFAQKAEAMAHNVGLLKGNAGNGWMPAGFVKVFNSDYVQEDLLHKNEFIVFDEYACKRGAAYITPAADLLQNSFGTALSPDTLRDMYSKGNTTLRSGIRMISGDSFIMKGIDRETSARIFQTLSDNGIIDSSSIYTPVTVQRDALLACDLKSLLLDKEQGILGDKPWLVKEIETVLYRYLGGVELLPSGIRSDAKVIPVANCPRQFIIDNIEETFLFTVKENGQGVHCGDITESITVAAPLFDACVLRRCKSVSFEDSVTLAAALEEHGLLDARHIPVSQNCTLENVEAAVKGTKADAQAVYNLLRNSPLVDQAIFVSEELGISEELSKKIYDVFEREGMILENRVCMNLLFGMNPETVFSELIGSGEVKIAWLDAIYGCLLDAPAPVSVKYWAKEGAEADKERYTVMRLTSGATPGLKAKASGGLRALLGTDSQNRPVVPVLPFERYKVADGGLLEVPKALDGAAVDFEGLYGEYFWELFYHIPMLAAQNLKNGFMNELGKEWYEYVFNPVNKEQLIGSMTFFDEAPGEINEVQSQGIFQALLQHQVIDGKGRVSASYDRDLSYLSAVIPDSRIIVVQNILENYLVEPDNAFYWNFYPFRNYKAEKLLDILSDDNPAVSVYNDDPYDPHAIARLRIGAYEKYTMIQYIDNLILWGDRKFMQNSWESITSASMYYTLASQMLGKRPEMIGTAREKEILDFQAIADAHPVIPQFLIEAACMCNSDNDDVILGGQAYYVEDSTYFNVPENDELTKYWDIVEDRLYKLRNSLDINGNPRTVPLYGTPVSPLALAKKSYVAQGMMAPAGYGTGMYYPYRFGFLAEQAKGLANVLVSVGSQMLSVMEKKDSESYMAMLSANEKTLLDMAVQMKENQIKEQEAELKSLKNSLESAQHRLQYYEQLITQDLSEGERKSLTASDTAFALSTAANAMKMSAGAAHALPQVGSPFAMTYGGIQVGSMLDSIANGMELGASIASFIAQRSLTMAGYERRKQEWEIQRDSIQYEIDGIGGQIEAADIRLQSAKTDLAVHQKTLAQKEETLNFLKEKFTSVQLYQWMQGRMNTLMWQSYQLVMELALGAQAAFWYEKDSDKSFLNYEYWDSGKCGLLSGESLLLALEQMQNEYFKKSQRNLEIEKHISLALNCPEAFLELKSGGKCTFDLTERMFDYDYPGMYDRKIVSVSITVPAVLGPYQSIHAVLTQTQNKVLMKADQEGLIYLLEGRAGDAPASVRVDQRINQRIALSKGVDDAGLISLNFGDERYLPFEGTGAVSGWQLEMPKNTNLFDYSGISDVILHMKYTAKSDDAFRSAVSGILNKYPRRGSIYYNLRQNFPLAWDALADSEGQDAALEITVACKASYIKNPVLKGVWFKFDFNRDITEDTPYQIMSLQIPSEDAVFIETVKDVGQTETCLKMEQAAGKWLLRFDTQRIGQYSFLQFLLKDGRLNTESLKNIEMLLVYEGSFS